MLGMSTQEVVVSNQIFPQFRPSEYRQSLLGQELLQKVNIERALVESAACFDLKMVRNA